MRVDDRAISAAFEVNERKLFSLELEIDSLADGIAHSKGELSNRSPAALRSTGTELRLRAQQASRLATSLAELASACDSYAELADCSCPEPPKAAVRAAAARAARRSP